MPWNDWLFWRGGWNQAAMRARGENARWDRVMRGDQAHLMGPDCSNLDRRQMGRRGFRRGLVLIVIPRPDAVEGIDMAQRHRIGLVEDDTGDAIADDLGVG